MKRLTLIPREAVSSFCLDCASVLCQVEEKINQIQFQKSRGNSWEDRATHSQCKFWAMHRLHGKGTSGSGPGTHRILWERHCEPARTVKPSSAHVADLHEWMAQEPTRLGRSDDGPLQLLAAVAAPYCPPCVTASGAAASCGRRRILEQLILLGELVVLLLVLLRVKVLVLFHDAAAITVLLLHRFPGYCTSLFSSSFAAFKIRSLNSEMPVDRTVT